MDHDSTLQTKTQNANGATHPQAAPSTANAKPAKRVWEARTGNATDALFLSYSESTATDARFVAADLAGSAAHVAGLAAAGLLATDEALALLNELQALAHAKSTGNLVLDPALEDVHMNIEARITETLGPVGAKLHTGRSRNDQVATCLVIHARQGLAEMAQAAAALAAALIAQGEAHHDVAWVARTHGQPAQPATLGFFLAAHAYRIQDAAKATLEAFEKIGESPLGAGAVAGSTLPLQPETTARLLGLRPLRNALLSTGTRDPVRVATAAAAECGAVAASLAEDLLQMTRDGGFRSPDAFTSGSSLMPQKRNPDALELARGKGKALLGMYVQVAQITTGLGLGYHRDFQETKPPLVAALQDAAQTLQVLAAVVKDGTFVADVLAKALDLPGITATDVAEALVQEGVPFRTAYTAVARAAQASLEGTGSFADALGANGLSQSAVDAALAALVPDPARRATTGGPAPVQVAAQLQVLVEDQESITQSVAAARQAADKPFSLLILDPRTIIEHALEEVTP